MNKKYKTLAFQYLKIVFLFFGFILIMIFKRQFFPSEIILYEGVLISLLFVTAIFLLKYLDLDKSIILFLVCFLFWSLLPTIIDRSVSVTILGKLNTSNYVTYDELSIDFNEIFLKDNDAIGKRLNEQISNGNITSIDNKYVLSKKGSITKKSFIFISRVFNINNSMLEKR